MSTYRLSIKGSMACASAKLHSLNLPAVFIARSEDNKSTFWDVSTDMKPVPDMLLS